MLESNLRFFGKAVASFTSKTALQGVYTLRIGASVAKLDDLESIAEIQEILDRGDPDEMLLIWNAVRKEMAPIAELIMPLASKEMALRKRIIETAFPLVNGEVMSVEGTKYKDLANGWKMKGVIKVERKLDEAAWPAVEEQLQKLLIATGPLVRRKPELVVKEYKQLTKEMQKIVDQALDIKMGTPTLEIVPPKVG